MGRQDEDPHSHLTKVKTKLQQGDITDPRHMPGKQDNQVLNPAPNLGLFPQDSQSLPPGSGDA